MLDTLLNFISSQKLFQPEQKILLAVSGGIDSMVMEHLFWKAGFRYAIAHCNFKLRGKDSDEDQRWIEEFALKREIPLFSTSFETAEYASENNISMFLGPPVLYSICSFEKPSNIKVPPVFKKLSKFL